MRKRSGRPHPPAPSPARLFITHKVNRVSRPGVCSDGRRKSEGGWGMELARWAEQEFGRAELGDERRTRRLQQLGTAMAEHASSSLPEVCEDWAEQKAGYRFF